MAAARRKLFYLPLLLLAGAAAHAAVGPASSNEQSSVRLISPWRVAPSSGDLELGLHFTTAPSWHVYWKNSGDAGYPPSLELTEAGGRVAGSEILWPVPHRFDLPGGLVAFGYEDEVVYPVRVTRTAATGAAPADRLVLSAEVDYLVCEVDCIPYSYTLKIDQPIAATGEADPATAPLFERWRGQLPTPLARAQGAGSTAALEAVNANEARLDLRLTGVAPDPAGVDVFFESDEHWQISRPEIRAADGGLAVSAVLKATDANKGLPESIALAWTATGVSLGGKNVNLEDRAELSPKRAAAAAEPSGSASSTGPWYARPAVAALAAVVLTLLALSLLGRFNVPGIKPATGSSGLTLLGFATLAAVVAPLYALSQRVSSEGLAGVEITLLGLALAAWLGSSQDRSSWLKAFSVAAILACAAAAPWLAETNRLPGGGAPGVATLSGTGPQGPSQSLLAEQSGGSR